MRFTKILIAITSTVQRAASGRLRGFRIAALSFLLLIPAGCWGGDSNDNGSEMGPWVYYSQDDGEIELSMPASVYVKDGIGNEITESAPLLTTKIPRNVLSVCFPYSRKSESAVFRVKRLPDKVSCYLVAFSISHVDGKSWKDNRDYSRGNIGKIIEKQNPEEFGILPEDGSVDLRRYFQNVVEIEAKPARVVREGRLQRKVQDRVEGYDGFQVFRRPNTSWTFYFDHNAADGIYQITCSNGLERTKPGFFCTYHFAVSSDLRAKVEFIDFRIHGGRRFAQARVRAIKKHICPIFKCDQKALRAADVRGGPWPE
jgi:hypothetical protein